MTQLVGGGEEGDRREGEREREIRWEGGQRLEEIGGREGVGGGVLPGCVHSCKYSPQHPRPSALCLGDQCTPQRPPPKGSTTAPFPCSAPSPAPTTLRVLTGQAVHSATGHLLTLADVPPLQTSYLATLRNKKLSLTARELNRTQRLLKKGQMTKVETKGGKLSYLAQQSQKHYYQ